jgi:Putative Ig domain
VLDKLIGKTGIDQTTTAPPSQPKPAPGAAQGATLAITSSPKLDDATKDKPYTAKLTATGGTGKLKWSVASGSTLPAGLQLAEDTITGTPTAQGTFTFKVTVTDESAKTASQELTLKAN